MAASSAMDEAWVRWVDAFFWLSLACCCGFVLWLPVFPSGDGPLHIYFSGVLWELATHPTIYSSYFAIRHLVQPYSLHYFALIGLGHFVTSAVAEKICVVGVLLAQAVGFRFLAGRLGAQASVASLLMVPLLFSWCLGGGFFNFCFSTGIAFFAFGFWFSLPPDGSRHGGSLGALVGFFLSLVALVLSHPVPLMVVIVLAGGDLLLLAIERRGQYAAVRLRLLAFAGACLAFVAPAMLADKGRVGAAWGQFGVHAALWKELVQGVRVSLFAGTAPAAMVYQAAVVLAVPAVLLLQWKGVRRRARTAALTASDRLLLLAVLYTGASTFFPTSLNGSAFFAERMWSMTWPLVLVTVAGATLSVQMRRVVAAVGVAWIAVTLPLVASTLTPIARKQAMLAAAELPDGERGLFLAGPHGNASRLMHTHYNEYFWGGGRAFARHRDVLLNSPWLGLTILPIRERAGARMTVDTAASREVEDPMRLYAAMRASAAVREAVLADADFILYADPLAGTPRPLADVAAVMAGQELRWSCSAAGFYAVCRRNR